MCALAALVALGAAQPVIETSQARSARTDAEIIFVLDISRSMLAAAGADAPTRFARARDAAKRLRAATPDVPAGVASFTDRVLPHLFPTADRGSFDLAVERGVAIDRPPPSGDALRSTSFLALAALAEQDFFSATARRRIAVILTDGESTPVTPAYLRDLFQSAGIDALFVRFWAENERVYSPRGVPEPYRPDPASSAELATIARTMGGQVFTEADVAAAAEMQRELAGRGPKRPSGEEREPTALAPYPILAALVPLSVLLWRRNL